MVLFWHEDVYSVFEISTTKNELTKFTKYVTLLNILVR